MTNREHSKEDILEAINVANEALYHLEDAEKALAKAKNWGIVDILGGKLIITGIKRDYMNKANQSIAMAEGALDALNDRLKALGQRFTMHYFSDSGVVDYLFDNFVLDIVTQNQIKKVYNEVLNTIAQVEGILDGLEHVVAEYV